MTRLQALIFDVGGTLVPNPFPVSDEEFAQLCLARLTAAFGAQLPWFQALVRHDFPNNGVAAGTLRQDVAGEVARFLDSIGVELPPEALAAICRACAVPLPQLVSLRPGAEAAVRGARDLGLRLAICSNTFWRGDAAVADDWRTYGLATCFDAYITSPSTGYVKPHPAIFRRALDALGVPPSEAAFVGDQLHEDMSGGRAAGLRTIWLRPAGAEDPADLVPDAVLDSLTQLVPVLRAWMIE
jgi:HAD superfamily hydrolase (TIGR01509 family)